VKEYRMLAEAKPFGQHACREKKGIQHLIHEGSSISTKLILIKATCPGFKDTLKNMSLKAETTCLICLALMNYVAGALPSSYILITLVCGITDKLKLLSSFSLHTFPFLSCLVLDRSCLV
jgi:hypothetical protein